MNQYIGIFIALAVMIGVGTLVIAISYDSISLPGRNGTTTVTVPAVLPAEPDSISNLAIWLDADDDSTISIGVGVSQWDDKSGNSNHVTQAVGTDQPTVVVDSLNGKNILSFDGSDYLQIQTLTQGVLSEPNTMFMVLTGGNSASQEQFTDGSDTTNRQSTYSSASTGYLGIYQTSIVASTETAAHSEWFLSQAVFSTTDQLYKNGTLIASGNAGSGGLGGFTVAARHDEIRQAEIDVAEIIVFDKALNSTEVDMINDYVEYKYDLGLTLVGNYSEATTIQTSGNATQTGWGDTQDVLDSQSQAATSLLVVVLVVFAAVVILVVVRKLNG